MTDQTRRQFIRTGVVAATAALVSAPGRAAGTYRAGAQGPATQDPAIGLAPSRSGLSSPPPTDCATPSEDGLAGGYTTTAGPPFQLGVASYSFRAFSVDKAIGMTQRLGVKQITLKDMHLPLQSTDQEMQETLSKIRTAGLKLTACGVVYMQTEEEVRKGFAYARRAGLHMLVGAPDVSLLSLAEQCAKETDISLAIHNHGPTDKRFPSPESAYALIGGMDRRMGLCVDVGHTMRLGLDPAREVERFFDRLLDIHIKDVSAPDASGTTVEIGRGVIHIPQLLRTLVKLGYNHTLHLEFEKDEQDPLPGMAESVGYLRGALAAL